MAQRGAPIKLKDINSDGKNLNEVLYTWEMKVLLGFFNDLKT